MEIVHSLKLPPNSVQESTLRRTECHRVLGENLKEQKWKCYDVGRPRSLDGFPTVTMLLSPSIEPCLLRAEGPFTQLAKGKKAWVIHSPAGLATREETVRSHNFPKEKFWHQLPTHRIG